MTMITVKDKVSGIKGLTRSQQQYILGNLAIAGIQPTSNVTAKNVSIIKKLADRLKQKGVETRRVEEPKLGNHDASLLAGIDPQTGEKIPEITLPKGRRALYNPETRVVYPLPVKDMKNQPDEV